MTLRKFPRVEGLYVTRYVKGEKYPYRVGLHPGDEINIEGKSKFSVKGLKRYNPKELSSADSVDVSPTQAKVGQASPAPSVTEAARDTYTKEEVDAIVESVTEYVLGQVNSIAFDLRTAILIGAETADHNFCAVAKQFKTLNHDDD